MTDIKKYMLLSFFLLALFGCRREELPSSMEKLYIRAASVPITEDGNVSTKAVNTGYLTTFEPGDEIGVTGIDKDGNIIDVCNNVRFVYDHETLEDGVVWASFKNDRGYDFVERVDGAKYFAYYPYDLKWNGKDLDYILTNFEVRENQSTKDNFDASDLMAPAEPLTPENGELRFVFEHKMTTISIFYNNEWLPDGITPLYSINLYDATSPAGLRMENTYRAPISETQNELRHRYLVNPLTTSEVKLVGCLEEKSHRLFSYTFPTRPGTLISISFEGEPLVPYTDGVDLGLDDVEFEDRDGNTVTLGYKVIWSKYNLGESLGESYPFAPLSTDRGTQRGSRDSYARGDYYCWGATYTQYDNGISGYMGYGYNNYFDQDYKIAPLGGTIKETEYDVAHAKWWRGKWRLPTENEFRAMYAGCTFETVASYKESHYRYMGRTGSTASFNVIKVTSKINGNFVYFSTGGYLDGTMEILKDEEGNVVSSGDGKLNSGLLYPSVAYYMTSSASPKILRCVSYAYFTADSQLIKVDGSRYTGMLVRPVYSPNE